MAAGRIHNSTIHSYCYITSSLRHLLLEVKALYLVKSYIYKSVSHELSHTQFVTRLDQSNNSSARHKSYQSIYEGYFTSNLRQSFILKLFRGDREVTVSSRSRGHVKRLKVVKVVVGSGY